MSGNFLFIPKKEIYCTIYCIIKDEQRDIVERSVATVAAHSCFFAWTTKNIIQKKDIEDVPLQKL